MSDVEAFYIPKNLDKPERFLFWSIDEAVIMLTPVFFGIMLGYTLIGMICGISLFLGWRKLKGSQQANLIIYGAYWYLPTFLLRLKATPPSYNRIYVG